MLRRLLPLVLIALAAVARADDPPELANPTIDMPGHLRLSAEAAEHRRTRRISEAQFIRMSREPGTVILDARSREMYQLTHVRGAINLSFPDIDVASLARTIPDRNTRILIYCNNNFSNMQRAFPSKRMEASLNLFTYEALYIYGYRNVYELGPLLDYRTTRIPFESMPGFEYK
ncbi:MAG TPA: rhodanese-like domain-containing protein [Candidatus Eisenbacteria bacterium]|nr:rhodanese-like domain-containing protein [Candidatus Eisenbacteria bacterium]